MTLLVIVVDLADALKERFVEHNLVLEVGQHGLYLLFKLAQFRRLVGLYQGKEYAGYAVEQASALLVGQDGVLEGGRVRAVDNLLYVVALLLDGSLERRQIVGDLNLAEVGGAVRQLALCEQGILMLRLLAGAELHRQCRCDSDGHNSLCYIHSYICNFGAKIRNNS